MFDFSSLLNSISHVPVRCEREQLINDEFTSFRIPRFTRTIAEKHVFIMKLRSCDVCNKNKKKIVAKESIINIWCLIFLDNKRKTTRIISTHVNVESYSIIIQRTIRVQQIENLLKINFSTIFCISLTEFQQYYSLSPLTWRVNFSTNAGSLRRENTCSKRDHVYRSGQKFNRCTFRIRNEIKKVLQYDDDDGYNLFR